jgi:hypothetical protein
MAFAEPCGSLAPGSSFVGMLQFSPWTVAIEEAARRLLKNALGKPTLARSITVAAQ